MANRKASGELPDQGLGNPYKTNSEHYFYYQQLFQQEFLKILLYVEFCFQDQIKNLIKYLIKILQRFKEIVTNNTTIHQFN